MSRREDLVHWLFPSIFASTASVLLLLVLRPPLSVWLAAPLIATGLTLSAVYLRRRSAFLQLGLLVLSLVFFVVTFVGFQLDEPAVIAVGASAWAVTLAVRFALIGFEGGTNVARGAGILRGLGWMVMILGAFFAPVWVAVVGLCLFVIAIVGETLFEAVADRRRKRRPI